MKQFHQLLMDILDSPDAQTDMTRSGETKKIFGYQNRYDLREGFPILTTKEVHFKSIFYELIWFLSGRNDLRYLISKKVKIWNDDAYRVYKEFASKLEEPDYRYHTEDTQLNTTRIFTMDEFIHAIVNDDEFNAQFGDLGPIYGKGWREFNGDFDQIKKAIDTIKKDKNNRRIIVNAWNPSLIDKMVLPPCHVMFQFACFKIENPTDERTHYLDCLLYQRSADSFLGVPFNITSYSLLMEIIGVLTNTVPRYFIHTFGDLHIYTDHLPQVEKILSRKPYPLPTLKFNKQFSTLEEVENLEFSDVELVNYQHHEKIAAKVLVG